MLPVKTAIVLSKTINEITTSTDVIKKIRKDLQMFRLKNTNERIQGFLQIYMLKNEGVEFLFGHPVYIFMYNEMYKKCQIHAFGENLG